MNESPATKNGAAVAVMKRLSKQDILQAQDRRTIEVEVPAWGGVVMLRELSAAARNDLSRVYNASKDQPQSEQGLQVAEAIFLASVVDENNNPMFTTEELPMLRQKSAATFDLVTRAALELNGMKPGATAEKEKNS